MWLNQMVIINQPQKFGQKINSWISPAELWQGLLICPIIKITQLATATANGDAVSRVYGDGRYVKKVEIQ